MSKDLPDGPFFDLIREWNAGVAELRAKIGDVQPGCMYVQTPVVETLAGMKIVINPTVPPDEVQFRDADGKIVGRIVGLAT